MNGDATGCRSEPAGTPFWQALDDKGESVALVDSERNQSWSYRALDRCVMDVSRSPWTTLAGVTKTYELMRERNVTAKMLRGARKLMHSGDRMPRQLFSWLSSTFAGT